MQIKLIRITTVPQSLRGLLKGQLNYMSKNGFEVIGVSSPGEALNDVERNEGVKTVGIEMTRSITPIQDLNAVTLPKRVDFPVFVALPFFIMFNKRN